jgi:hypothetical protein
MTTEDDRPSRLVMPRRWLIAGAIVTIGGIAAKPGRAQTAEGGEGGEGGEGAAIAEADGAVALLTALGLMEGHLRAGSALYQAGHSDMALTHKKHPSEEIYTDLEPMLEAVGAPEFEDELAAMADAVSAGASPEIVAAAEAQVLASIETARQAAGATPAELAESIETLVRTAAEEYGIGIVDGQVSNLHEYQDAWGFMQVARSQTEVLAAAAPEVAQAITEALAPTEALFPELVPAGGVDGNASVLQGAAARVEIARLQL